MRARAVLQLAIEAIDKASSTLNKIGKSAGKMGKAWGAASKAIRIASIAGVAAFGAMTVASLNAASDLEESQSKVEVVFEESAGIIKRFASDSARSLGISRAAAFEAAGTFGNLLTAMGESEESAANMSVGLVQLGSDLASFNNLDPTEVLDKLRAGITGEAEPLKALGVNITAARTTAKALELGLIEVGDEMTEQAKITARYAIIMEDTTKAQGDFARTSTGMANAQRIVKAQITDLAAAFGTLLLPVVAKALAGVIGALGSLTDWFFDHEEQIKQAMVDIAAKVRPFAEAFILGAQTIIEHLTPLFRFIKENKPAMIATLVAIGVAVTLAFGPVGVIVVAIAAAVTALGFLRKNWDEVTAFLRERFDRVVAFLREKLEAFRVFWLANWRKMALALGPLGLLIIVIVQLRDKIRRLFEFFVGVIQKAAPKVFAILQKIAGGFETFARIVVAFVQPIIDKIQALINIIGKIPTPDLSGIGDFVGGAAGAIGGILGFKHGGTVGHSGPALVGEGGPEIVNLRAGSRVAPNSALGGMTVIVNVTEPLGTPSELGEAVVRALVTLERTGRITQVTA